MTKRTFTNPYNEKTYPLYEADHDNAFTCYRSDKAKAQMGDPTNCWLARGLHRQRNVKEAFIGSGRDAYVVYGPTNDRPFDHAVHFVIGMPAGRLRDLFDQNKKLASQVVILKAPSLSETKEARSESNKRRRIEVKNGAPVKHRDAQRRTRLMRFGIKHRPSAITRKGGRVTLDCPTGA